MLRLTTPPAVHPIALSDAERHVFSDDPGDSLAIKRMVRAATHMVQTETARQFVNATWTLTLDSFPAAIELRVCPVQSVTSVKYYDTAGAQQTLDSSDYLVDTASEPGRITPAPNTVWPVTQQRANAVEVVFTAGYGDSHYGVPEAAQQAILLLVGNWFANREPVGTVGGEIALTYRSLVNSLKWTL